MSKTKSLNKEFEQLLINSFFETVTLYTTIPIKEHDNKAFNEIETNIELYYKIDKLSRTYKHILSAEENWKYYQDDNLIYNDIYTY